MPSSVASVVASEIQRPLLLNHRPSASSDKSRSEELTEQVSLTRGISDMSVGGLDGHHLPGPEKLLVPRRWHAGGSPGLTRQIPAAIVTVMTSAIFSVTYGNLAFGVLDEQNADGTRPPVPNGVTIWLLCCGVSQVSQILFSGVSFGVTNGALEMLPIFHQIFRSVMYTVAEDATGPDVAQQATATCIATVFTSTLCLGTLLVTGAKLGCSRWLRCVPVVVLKGALFGVAIFLLQSTFTETAKTKGVGVSQLLEQWQLWMPAVLIGTFVFVLDEVTHSPVAILMVLLGVAVSPQVAQLCGVVHLDELAQNGFLLGSADDVAGRGPTVPWYSELLSTYSTLLPCVNWLVVLSHLPAMCGLWLTHILCTLMDLKAIELLTESEMNLDKELMTVGMGNLLSVMAGSGWPVYILCSQTVTSFKLGGRTKAVGIAKAICVIPMLFVVQDVVPRLPRALPGGVSWWLGLSFIKETGIDIILQHSHGFDVIIVTIMGVTIMLAGLLQGLQVGFLLALLAFVQRYSRLSPVVRSADNASFLHSNNSRSMSQYHKLERLGRRVRVFHLEGYIMFGSSPQLVDQVKPLLEPGGPSWIVLSFRGVRGVDYSATCDLAALARRAAGCQCSLVVTELNGAVREALRRARLKIPELTMTEQNQLVDGMPFGICMLPHYNLALKVCEDALLATTESESSRAQSRTGTPSNHQEAAMNMLRDCVGDFMDDSQQGLKELMEQFEQVVYHPGETLWHAHDSATFCVGVVDGWLQSLQPQTSEGDSHIIMEVVNVGAFVGFSGLLNQLTYSQTVVVPTDGVPTRVLKLSWQGVVNLMEQRPRIANALFRAFLRRQAYEFRALSRLAAQV